MKELWKAITNPCSPHFWWLFGVMLIIIILLSSLLLNEKVYCAKTIMDFITNASTLLSITLSIFAIMYTYTSNQEINRQFQKINDAATIITNTSDKLSESGSKLNSNLDEILSKLNSVDENQREIKNNLKNKDIDDSKISKFINSTQDNPNNNWKSES